MATASPIRWHRGGHFPDSSFGWHAEVNGQIIAYATKSGTHLDDYPWDWWMAHGLNTTARRRSGTTDTLRDCKDMVRIAWEARL